jgi:hypothetical protein
MALRPLGFICRSRGARLPEDPSSKRLPHPCFQEFATPYGNRRASPAIPASFHDVRRMTVSMA